MDKTSILENLINYFTGGNKAKFATMVGVSPQLISTWLARNTFNAEILYTKCEGVNASWLLTGEGEMFSTPVRPVVEQAAASAPTIQNQANVHGDHNSIRQQSIPVNPFAAAPRAAALTAEKKEIALARLQERVKALEAALTAQQQTLTAQQQTITAQQELLASQRDTIAHLKTIGHYSDTAPQPDSLTN